MIQAGPRVSTYEELIRVVHHVRRRWRLRLALRGAAVVIASGLVVFAVSAYGMDAFRYSEGAVVAFRALAYVALAALVVRFLILLPLFQRVGDQQVALYIEEHEPSLQQALVSAVEAGKKGRDADSPQVSPALIERLVATAAERCEAMDCGRGVEHRSLQRASGIVAALAVVGMAAVALSPAFLRHGASLLLNPFESARAASPYFISVEPGNVVVGRGADQMVSARLGGFDSDRVELAAQSAEDGGWKRWPMSLEAESERYAFLILDLQNRTEYFVEAGGVRSDVFRIDVSDLPFVERIDLEYRFPAYTGLSTRVVEDGGDISAVRGTVVALTVTPTVRVAGGRIQIERAEPIPMEVREDGTLLGALEVLKEGFYRIDLQAIDGTLHHGSPDYAIEPLADEPPVVVVSKPGRDSKASSVEEVFAEVKAEDDFGLSRLDLVYSVNGGSEETVTLYRKEGNARKDLVAGHTFFLEDRNLEAGDFISYYARATDTDRISGRKSSTTDIYFIEVRPFGKEYRQSQQSMQGGSSGGADGALSVRQRQIIAATFKLVRDRKIYSEKDYAENLTTIALMQGRLREQVENLLGRMSNRGIVDRESDFGRIGEHLELAIREMEPAEEKLVEKNPSDALPPEQRALQHLQRAESFFRDVQVSFGSGSGGSDAAAAEDLADLFELELDKLRNQYETVERGERESAANQIDEALQRLQELARRQQQENERSKRRGTTPPGASGRGSSASQRELADATEELARKLERLAREESLPDLVDTSQRLKQAADSMRRGASGGAQGSSSEGIAALDKLKDARRLLEKNRSVRLEQDIAETLSRAERLQSQQDKMVSDVRRLGQGGSESSERVEELLERKEDMAAEVADLESEIDRMARESRAEQKEASRKLQQAANSIRDNKLKEKIRYSKGVVQGRSPEYAERFEDQVRADLGELVERLEDAAGSMGKSEERKVADAVDKAGELVRNMESLGERVRERQLEARNRREGSPGRSEPSNSGETNPGGHAERGSVQPGQGEPAEPTERGPWGEPGVAGAGSQDGRFQPGTFSTEELRQWRHEFRERAQEVEALRRELDRLDLDVPDLQSIIERMKAFDQKQIYLDPLGFDQLESALLEELKQFEYSLRRQLDGGGNDRLYLGGADQVPSEFRKLVEEYYRSLSRERGKDGSR